MHAPEHAENSCPNSTDGQGTHENSSRQSPHGPEGGQENLQPRALDGVTVIDLTQALSGPFCTSLLADQGAKVIKIESPRGDMLRQTDPFSSDDTEHSYGGVFGNANRNKRSVVLDLKVPEARDVLLHLIDTADVLVENFSSRVMERLGLGYDELAARNPRLVYTSIRGFGDARGGRSPYQDWPAFDIVAQAMGGIMSITGTDTAHRVRVGSGIGDTVPAIYAAFGTVTALLEARRSGLGQYVDIAMVDSVLSVSEVVVNNYSRTGISPEPIGNQLQGFAPFDVVPAKDGEVALGAPHNAQWAKLCIIMDRDDLITDPRFNSDENRWNNRDELYATLNAWTAEHTMSELIELLGGTVPLGPIFAASDIFADPHFSARAMLPTVEQPGSARPATLTGVVPKLSRTPGDVRHRAPRLGEHTVEVLREAGLSEAELAGLAAVGGTVLPASADPTVQRRASGNRATRIGRSTRPAATVPPQSSGPG